jgi:hypothetical protein
VARVHDLVPIACPLGAVPRGRDAGTRGAEAASTEVVMAPLVRTGPFARVAAFVALAPALVAISCATVQPPNSRLTQSEAAIAAADAAGASDNPQAALHLQLAREGVEGAKRLIADNEMARADLMLQRAAADAELAMALARQGAAYAEAQRIQQEIVALEGETIGDE